MADLSASPSVGIDADTGRRIEGWPHVAQSLRDIFLTGFGERLMREWYGSFVLAALGRNITAEEMLPVIASITSAIEQWEPRYVVTGVEIGGTIRDGRLSLTLTGEYRPRALLGDASGDEERQVVLALSQSGISMEG
jgi:phage baseplate assembly protein W